MTAEARRGHPIYAARAMFALVHEPESPEAMVAWTLLGCALDDMRVTRERIDAIFHALTKRA